jgi:hypothetical protein
VSELSHKLGSAQGSSQSLEQEVGQLRAQLKQLAGEKHGLALQEKVRTPSVFCSAGFLALGCLHATTCSMQLGS